MRNPDHRLKVDTLYILGAGASYGASIPKSGAGTFVAPLDKDLAARILDLAVANPRWIEEAIKRVVSQWKDHRAFRDCGLEEAVLLQLGHLEFLRGIHPRRARFIPTPGEWLGDIAHLICYILKRSRPNKQDLYTQLALSVLPKRSKVANCRNRVITFNYDTMLDSVFLERTSPQQLYFDKIVGRSGVGAAGGRVENPLLLKLHGSINWRCSADDFRHVVDASRAPDDELIELGDITYEEGSTPDPEDDICPLIIPPLPSKPVTSIRIFQYLWSRAYEYLHEAKELIICGYSLPLADQMAVSMFSNFRNRDIRKVTVVDPSPFVLSRWRDVFRRTSVGVTEWRYCETFEEFMEHV